MQFCLLYIATQRVKELTVPGLQVGRYSTLAIERNT